MIGRVLRGKLVRGANLVRVPESGAPQPFRLTKLFGARGLERVELEVGLRKEGQLGLDRRTCPVPAIPGFQGPFEEGMSERALPHVEPLERPEVVGQADGQEVRILCEAVRCIGVRIRWRTSCDFH